MYINRVIEIKQFFLRFIKENHVFIIYKKINSSLSKKSVRKIVHMADKSFILTDKIEFVPDEDLEGELNFNLRATG